MAALWALYYDFQLLDDSIKGNFPGTHTQMYDPVETEMASQKIYQKG